MKSRLLPALLYHDGNISNRNQARALAYGLRNMIRSVMEVDILKPTRSTTMGEGLVIGCGHRVANIVSASRKEGHKTIQILHPRWTFSTGDFDCLVLPYHDRLGWFDDERKVVRMHGSLSWSLQREALQRYREFGSNGNATKQKIGVFIGGSVNHRVLVNELTILQRNGYIVDIVTSRRTPTDLVRRLVEGFGSNVWTFGSKIRNPYRYTLATSEALMVSIDSISMVSDALTTLCERQMKGPLFLLEAPSTYQPKYQRFLACVNARNEFKNNLVHFTSAQVFYEQVHTVPACDSTYEPDRVAGCITQLLFR